MIRRRIAASLIAAGIVFGAFGAHALRARISPEMFVIYEKAVFYHLINAVGLLALSAPDFSLGRAKLAYTLIACGVAIFSGSLYLLALTGTSWLGAITPVGGILFIAGWLLVAAV